MSWWRYNKSWEQDKVADWQHFVGETKVQWVAPGHKIDNLLTQVYGGNYI